MAFDKTGMRRYQGGRYLSGTNSVRGIYYYWTPDTAAVVEAAGYFNFLPNLPSAPNTEPFKTGDMIHAVMAIAGTPILKNYVVTVVTTGGAVTVALQTTTAG